MESNNWWLTIRWMRLGVRSNLFSRYIIGTTMQTSCSFSSLKCMLWFHEILNGYSTWLNSNDRIQSSTQMKSFCTMFYHTTWLYTVYFCSWIKVCSLSWFQIVAQLQCEYKFVTVCVRTCMLFHLYMQKKREYSHFQIWHTVQHQDRCVVGTLLLQVATVVNSYHVHVHVDQISTPDFLKSWIAFINMYMYVSACIFIRECHVYSVFTNLFFVQFHISHI